MTKSVLFRGSWTMAERGWSQSWAIWGPQLGLRSVCLSPHAEMGETLPESHGYGAVIELKPDGVLPSPQGYSTVSGSFVGN